MPDVRAAPRMSGSPSHAGCPVFSPDVRLPVIPTPVGLHVAAGCPGFARMSGPSRVTECPGLAPDVRPLCFSPGFSSVLLVPRQPGCPATLPGCPACPFAYAITATFELTLYIALLPHGRRLTTHFEQTLEHISLSLNPPHQILDPQGI